LSTRIGGRDAVAGRFSRGSDLPLQWHWRNYVSEEQNKQVFRMVIEEAYTKGNMDALDKAFAPNFVEHQAGILPPTAEGVR